MSRSCVCDGGTENCRFCNGSGTINDRLADALVSHAQRSGVLHPSGGALPVGKTKSLSKTRFVGQRRPAVKKIAAPKLQRQNLVPCSVLGCTSLLNPRNVSKHLKKVHGKPRPNQFNRTVTAQSPIVVKIQGQPHSTCQLVPCPAGCPAKLNPTPHKVRNHLKKVHPTFQQAENKGSIPAVSSPRRTASVVRQIVLKSIPDGIPRVPSSGNYPERSLDATKEYAHAYRENGHFGSYPSHDAYDDESGPE